MNLASGVSAEKKKKKCQCLVIGCTEKSRGRKSKLCCKHEHESRKEKNPHQYWYGVLRRNAKRRGKVFTISLEYFIQFCNETNYINLKGKKSGSMTIDRIIDELGYIEGNLQIMEVGCNTRKRYVEYWQRQESTWQEPKIDTDDIFPAKKPIDPLEETPF